MPCHAHMLIHVCACVAMHADIADALLLPLSVCSTTVSNVAVDQCIDKHTIKTYLQRFIAYVYFYCPRWFPASLILGLLARLLWE